LKAEFGAAVNQNRRTGSESDECARTHAIITGIGRLTAVTVTPENGDAVAPTCPEKLDRRHFCQGR
jgi:hypothetical protein